MRTVAAAVVAVLVFTAISVWFFLLRDGSPLLSPEKVTLAEALSDVPKSESVPPTTPAAPEVPAVTTDAETEAEHIASVTASITFHGVAQIGASGAPVAGATVRLLSTIDTYVDGLPEIPELAAARKAFEMTATTDADGAYRLELKEIDPSMLFMAAITCEAPGYARAHVSLDTPGELADGMEQRQDFFLKAGSKVYGRVTQTDTGAAVEGARVKALLLQDDPFSGIDPFDAPQLTATSGADGSYEVTGLEEGTYTIIASTPDSLLTLTAKLRPRVKVMPGQDTQKDLLLSPAAMVRGAVRFPADAVKPEFASVMANRHSRPMDILSDGLAEMMHDSFAESSSEVDGDNNYQINGLEYGVEYTVELMSEDFAKTESAPFTIAEGQSPMTVDLVVLRGSTLRGKATYEDGKPAAGVDLQLSRGMKAILEGDFDGYMTGSETKDDGSFEIKNVNAGEYKVVAQKDMFENFNPFTRDSEEDDVGLVSVDGVNDVDGLLVTVKGNAPAPGTGVITGRLLDQGGNPVGEWSIHAFSIEDGDMKEATTAADGTFRLEKLSEGAYTVSTSRDGEQAQANDVQVGSDITLQFAPEAVISGTVVDAAGEPVDGCTVRLEARREGVASMFDPEQMMGMMGMRGDTARTDTFGLFEIKYFEPGRYVVRVSASSAGYGESEAFAVADGESKSDVHIKLAKGVVFSGTVVDSAGKPIAGARVSLSETASSNPMMEQMMEYMPEMMQQGGESVETDESGAFAFHNLAPGDYKLAANAENFAGARDDVALVAGRDVTGHKITLSRGGCIAGAASVKGVVKAGLMVQAVGGGGTKQATSGEDGHFELCGLNAGTYMVTVMDMSGMMSGDISGMMPTMRKADVRDGETTEVDFGPKEGTVSVRGVVKGERGQVTTVSLQKPGAPEPSLADAFNMDAAMEMMEFMGGQAMCDAGGAFEIHEVTPGDYVLEVHSVTIDMENMSENMEMFGQSMKPAIRQEVTVPANTGLTLELELPAKE